jgi:hypothetical protein
LKKMILFIAVLFTWCAITQADVVIKRKTTADMAGLMTMETNGSDVIKGDKSITDMKSEMTGGMMAKLGGGKPKETINIIRLDKGIYYEIDPGKKVYAETPLSSLKEQFAKSNQESSDDSAKSEYIWTSDVKATDKKQKINGFDCKNVIGKAMGIKKDDPKDSVFITFDEWMATDVPGLSEVEQFQKNYAKALGMDEMWGQKNLGQMMKDYGPQMQALALKMKEAGGYPIKTVIAIEGSEKSSKESAGGSENEPNSKSDMMAKMGNILGKKKSDEPKSADMSESGHQKTLLMTTEILSIEQKPADDTQFEVPAGYKKK